jgi:hypothetical protein
MILSFTVIQTDQSSCFFNDSRGLFPFALSPFRFKKITAQLNDIKRNNPRSLLFKK